jgi:hypothetical protein
MKQSGTYLLRCLSTVYILIDDIASCERKDLLCINTLLKSSNSTNEDVHLHHKLFHNYTH